MFSGEVGILGLTQMTTAKHFEERVGRAGSLVEKELVFAANRVNYNQVFKFQLQFIFTAWGQRREVERVSEYRFRRLISFLPPNICSNFGA